MSGSVYQNQFPVAVPSTSDYVTGVQGGKSTNYLVSDVRDQALRTEVQNARNGQASLSAELSVITNSISAETTRATNSENTISGNVTTLTTNLNQLSNYNYVINGGFTINQRAVSGTVTLSANVYGHDRWKSGASGCTYTFATSNGTTTITITAGSLIQVIEGINLQSGNYTLSWSGTAQGKIGSGSFSNSPITANVTGATNLNIEFGTGTLTNVKVEKSSIATPFTPIFYAEELALCQRYYEITSSDSLFIGTYATTTGNLDFYIKYKTDKRSNPSMAFNHSTDLGKLYLLAPNIAEARTPTVEYINTKECKFHLPTTNIGSIAAGQSVAAYGQITMDAEIY